VGILVYFCNGLLGSGAFGGVSWDTHECLLGSRSIFGHSRIWFISTTKPFSLLSLRDECVVVIIGVFATLCRSDHATVKKEKVS
jgi:hypothetical protein